MVIHNHDGYAADNLKTMLLAKFIKESIPASNWCQFGTKINVVWMLSYISYQPYLMILVPGTAIPIFPYHYFSLH